MKQLSGLGHNLDNFLELAMLNYNSYAYPSMDKLSSFDCVLWQKAQICPSVEVIPEVLVTEDFKTYHLTLMK